MDSFNFMVAILLIMLAIQFKQTWMVFGVLAVMILTMRSVLAAVLLIGATFALFSISGTELNAYWPFIVVGLMVIALAFGLTSKPEQPEYYAPDLGGGYGDILGGAG